MNLDFNSSEPTRMHIDLNSCFASVEQQANPLLRGIPIAVAAYVSPNGCILAASREAKKFGVTTGMRVREGVELCPGLKILGPDPWKYRNVHLKLRNLLQNYSDRVVPKSIDEFVLDFAGTPSLAKGLIKTATEIKQRIRSEIGEWLSVSIGIAPNRFLAKTGSNLHKPDGLDQITVDNFQQIYANLALEDLTGIKHRNSLRLNSVGIFTVMDFFSAPIWKLKAAFESINGYYWYLRLHGYEIDDVSEHRRSYGNSYSLPKPLASWKDLSPIIQKLVEKMGHRLRRAGFAAGGVHLSILYRDGSYWHQGHKISQVIFDSRDLYRAIYRLFRRSLVGKTVRNIAVTSFDLQPLESLQLGLFEDTARKFDLTRAVDDINERWGDFVITPLTMLGTSDYVPDRIAFGNIKELEEFTLSQ